MLPWFLLVHKESTDALNLQRLSNGFVFVNCNCILHAILL